MTIMQPDITKIPAPYREALTSNTRRVVALQLTGVPEKRGAADAADPTGSRVGGLAFVTDDYPEPRDSNGGRMIFWPS